MEDLTLFHLRDCPYCHNARRALEELGREAPRFGRVRVEWVEESEHPERVEGHDYWYVPSVFLGKRKLYEAHPGESYGECRDHLRAALEEALKTGA